MEASQQQQKLACSKPAGSTQAKKSRCVHCCPLPGKGRVTSAGLQGWCTDTPHAQQAGRGACTACQKAVLGSPDREGPAPLMLFRCAESSKQPSSITGLRAGHTSARDDQTHDAKGRNTGVKVEQLRSRPPPSSNQRANTKRYTPTAHQTGSARPPKHRPQSSVVVWGPACEGARTLTCPKRHTSPSPLTPIRNTLHTRTPQQAVADCTHAQLPLNPTPQRARTHDPSDNNRTRCAAPAKPLAPHGPPHVLACVLV